jgi:hypothetical protein
MCTTKKLQIFNRFSSIIVLLCMWDIQPSKFCFNKKFKQYKLKATKTHALHPNNSAKLKHYLNIMTHWKRGLLYLFPLSLFYLITKRGPWSGKQLQC